jgi:hypothetical protein
VRARRIVESISSSVGLQWRRYNSFAASDALPLPAPGGTTKLSGSVGSKFLRVRRECMYLGIYMRGTHHW